MRTHSPAWKLATRFSIVVFLLISGTRSFAQEFPTLEWAKSFGTNPSYDIARSITTDASGNVFSAGGFRNTVDFDPSTGVFNLTAVGFDNRGPYMLKLDPDGNFLWAKTFTSTNTCFMGAITNDASGNLYVTGSFDGTVDFDPGPGTFNITNTGSFDSNFICKLDANGNFLWATNTTSNNSQAIASIAVDATQNVYTLGHFRGTVDFDPGTGISSLTPFGQWDVYLTKTGPSGNFISVQRLGGTDFDFGGSIGIDAAGNVYLSGVFQGTADFDPGAGTSNMTSTGLRDIFVVKLASNGSFIWAKRLGEAATDELGMAIKTDASGNIYGTGLYSGTWDFDPSLSFFNLTSSGGTDFYLLKLNANGDFVWAKSTGSSTHDDRVTDLAIDPTGVYATGYFNGTADFDPGSGTFTVTASNDSYILKLDLNGNFVWVAPSGDYGASDPKIITIDAAGNIFATGGFIAPLDADPDPCTEVGLLTGLIYLQKLSIGVAGGSCSPPTITSFTPTSGTFGTTVTITGTNFSIIPANNGVEFNGISANVTSSAATSITCEVPAGATTGLITVTVGGQSDTSTNDFTVTGSTITITTQPTSATVCDGTIVTFTTAATGTTNIIYQWQIEDSDGDWIDVINGGGYSGATTPVLTVNTSSNFGEGTYQCLVSGDFASNVDTNDVFLDIAPNAPFISDVVNCGPGAVTVNASGGTNGQYRWYTQASGGTAIPGEVNGIFTTPFLTSTTVYYVAINNGVCEGPRSDVQVAISTCQPQPGLVWAQGMGVGTMANGTNGGNTVLIDADGNLLVCGSFQGTIDFDNGPGTVNLTAGGTDSFLLKMTPSGTLLWAKGIGGPGSGSDGVSEMSIDGTGNIYMSFTFNGTADFDPGPGVASLTSTLSSPANKSDLAVAKYDRDGNFIWVRRIGGNNDERSGGLKADAAGNVYITGQFRGTTNFNGSFPRTALGANSTDVLFAKMDTNGTFIWAGSIGSPLATAANLFSDGGSAIDIDGTGNVYVSGRVYGPNTTVDFDPGTGTAPQAIIDQAGFVLKLDNIGVYQTHYIVEGAAGNVVSIDGSNNVYFTGAFTGTVDIDPGPGVFNVTGDGANYITKLNSSGNFVWGKVLNPGGFGVNPSVSIGGIVFDAVGDLHVTGYNTAGATDFDLGTLVEARGLNGLFVLNPFVWKLNSNGDFNWVTTMRRISGSFATASIASVAVSTTGDIFTTGNFARNVDLDPGLCEFGVTNLNGSDIFISRLSPAQPNVCIAQQPTNVSACSNDIVTFTTSATETGGAFYQWQKLNTITSLFENIGNGGGYSGATASTLTINTAANFGAGEYRCKVSGTSTVGAFSNSATLSFTTSATPQATGASGCAGASVTLIATGGSDGQYRWYTVSTGGTSIAGEVNSTFTTTVLNTTTTYYVAISNGTCESARATAIATINSPPAAPVTTGANFCGGGTVTLSASGGAAGEYRWYTVAIGGTAISGEVNSTLVTPVLTNTTTYYVSISNGTCESARTAVIATLTTTPAPTATGASGCPASVVTLTASGGTNGQYNWYTVATGGTAIAGATNNTYEIASLTNTSTFYVSLTISGCESTRTAVTATLLSTGCAPVITTQTLTTQIEGKIEINLQSFITTPGTLDPTSVKVVTQPASGAIASITNFLLIIDYKGKPFSGKETIIIEACNTNGLCAQQTFTIEVAGDVIVFNAVSPNGDGKNEFLVLQYIESISPKNQVSIYNRWGDEVFSISDYDNKTRVFAGLGTSGSKLPSGTYFYKITLIDTSKTLTGFFSLKY
jgi:gliding motility-associated-like protein